MLKTISPKKLYPTESLSMIKENKIQFYMNCFQNNIKTEDIEVFYFDNKYYILNGHHKMLAANRMHLPEVPIKVVDLSKISFWRENKNIIRNFEAIGMTALYDFEAVGGFHFEDYPDWYKKCETLKTEKIVIIINGAGGVGKDTLCDLAAKHYKTKSISAITPIKEIAEKYGWSGEKDAKSRKFLSDLKKVFIEYNDLPTKYLYRQYEKFKNSDDEILFVHIREKNEIDKFKRLVTLRCKTLLIDRQNAEIETWGNSSDDEVKNYHYDLYFKNDKELAEIEKEFIVFLDTVLKNP